MTIVGAEKAEPSGPPPYPSYCNHPQLNRHEKYYLEEGNVVILARFRLPEFSHRLPDIVKVDNTLFKVWDGSFRRHSEFFQKVSSPLLNIDKTTEGSDDEHPLILEGIQMTDFERLLWIVYPSVIGEFRAKTAQDWIAVLDLSTRWKFNDIRELSIKKLAKLDIDPVEKVELMQRYEVKRQWAYSAFITLCSRTNGLDVTEGQRLGVEMVIKIALVREKLEKWGRKKPDEVRKAVCEILELELEGSPLSTPK